MEIRQLEYFRAIVDAGTISGAARVLHMTQPPLSYQMKMLEEELQVSLFLRGTKKITLTDAGKTLYEQAGNLLMLADLTKQEVVKSGQAATLHIGITPSTVSMMSEKGLGIAILPESMLKLTNKLKAYDITGADLTTEILLAWRKGRMPAELQDFLTLFEEKI